jgi:PHP family Zn ribbon phosphoesterase
MREFTADLHIHTVLSPCGDLYMSPVNIVAEASRKKLDIIGITDHNTTRHCKLIKKLAEKVGITVLTGAEITTKEEIHCLTFFENSDTLDEFQEFIDSILPDIKNVPRIFGDQVQVDEYDNIVYTEERLLHNALDISADDLCKMVHSMGGLFIPAHIDRGKNSIYSQLGFLPEDFNADALEISAKTRPRDFIAAHPEVEGFSLITSSDAHFEGQAGRVTTEFVTETASFSEIRLALRNESGRRTMIK